MDKELLPCADEGQGVAINSESSPATTEDTVFALRLTKATEPGDSEERRRIRDDATKQATFLVVNWASIFGLRLIVGLIVICAYGFTQIGVACINADFSEQTFDYWIIIWTLLAKGAGARMGHEVKAAWSTEIRTRGGNGLSGFGRVLRALGTQVDLVGMVAFAICTRTLFGPWTCVNDFSHHRFGTPQVVLYAACLALLIIVAMKGIPCTAFAGLSPSLWHHVAVTGFH